MEIKWNGTVYYVVTRELTSYDSFSYSRKAIFRLSSLHFVTSGMSRPVSDG